METVYQVLAYTLVKTRLKRMQYRPGLIDGFLTKTGLDLTPELAQVRTSARSAEFRGRG